MQRHAAVRIHFTAATRPFVTLAVGTHLAATAVGSGCSSSTGEEADDLGAVEVAIKQVPEDVHCVRISAVGERSVTRDFGVMPDDSARLLMAGLSLGEVEFTGLAYAEPCSELIATSEEAWFSEPVLATLVRGERAKVALFMRRNGTAEVAVDFEDCGEELVEIEIEGAQSVIATALNDRGQVGGWIYDGSEYAKGFFWGEGQPAIIDPGVNINVGDVNERGQIIGAAENVAFLWEAGTAHSLGTLGGSWSIAHALNDTGIVNRQQRNCGR